MLRWIESADDVLALEVSQKLTGSDLDAIMDRLEDAIAVHSKIHVFVETRAVDAIELKGLGAYLMRALPLFAKLVSFGRVAVVADQSCLRALTRLESALLPHISYRVFKPDARDAALSWVQHEEPRPD